MTNKIVFDASALIMLFAKEPGYAFIKQHMKYAVISSVNIAEVYKYCIETQKLTQDDCLSLIKLSGIKIIDFCEAQALITAKIIEHTKPYGLSLADRSCIALAMFKNYSILTCDKIWQDVPLGINIIMGR